VRPLHAARQPHHKPRNSPLLRWFVYLVVMALFALACYRHPLADDFDRYVYEAIVRGQSQPLADVYQSVKHESPRAEASTILDSPEHLAKLEPLYKIRPVYLILISVMARAGLSIQHAINLISAASFFVIAIAVALWTRRLLLSALIVVSAPIFILGRMGTPDALSTAAVLLALLAIVRERINLGCILLLLSVWIRTDNIIVMAVTLVILGWEKLPGWKAAFYFATAVTSMMIINRIAGNYGWTVLFQWSFLPGTSSPADIHIPVTMREYLGVFLSSSTSLLGRLTLWMVLGLLTWTGSRRLRPLLAVASLSTAAHFVLYPSPEDRYLVWAYVVVGIAFVEWASARANLPTASHLEPAPVAIISSAEIREQDESRVPKGRNCFLFVAATCIYLIDCATSTSVGGTIEAKPRALGRPALAEQYQSDRL